MLEIKDLHVRSGDVEILSGIDLSVPAGEIHAIMGPNGSGKSTLSYVLAGREGYDVTRGHVTFEGQNVLEMSPEARAWAGIFLAFQYPVEIPGVQITSFLRAASDSVRKNRGQKPLDALEFLKWIKSKAQELHIEDSMLKRALNDGFSGGEKKRLEALQMAVLEPRLAILDETDSGLDIDALRVVAQSVNALRARDRAFLVITHYQRLLAYIRPDRVHVLAKGRIVRSGGPELAMELEAQGYAGIIGDAL